jgi:hypothetical protein
MAQYIVRADLNQIAKATLVVTRVAGSCRDSHALRRANVSRAALSCPFGIIYIHRLIMPADDDRAVKFWDAVPLYSITMGRARRCL